MVSSCGQRSYCSDCAATQADLSLRRMHMLLKYLFTCCGPSSTFAPGNSIYYKIACSPSQDSARPAHPRSVIRVFEGHWIGSYQSKASQWRLWSACADAQADLSLRWAHIQSCRKCRAPTRALIKIRPTYKQRGMHGYENNLGLSHVPMVYKPTYIISSLHAAFVLVKYYSNNVQQKYFRLEIFVYLANVFILPLTSRSGSRKKS